LVCTAQSSATDSLKSVLASGDLADTTRLRILVALSAQNLYSDFAQAQAYNDQALLLADKIEAPAYKAAAYSNAGLLYTLRGDFSTALKYDNLSLESSIATKDSVKIARDYNSIGNDYFDLGEYDDAYFYTTESHRIANLIGNPLRMLIALHNVGRVFKELGQYDQALEHIALSMKMSIQHGDREGLAYAHHEIGDIFMRQQKYDSAMSHLMKAKDLALKLGVNTLKPQTYSKIAEVYLQRKDFASALAYYDTAYALHQKTSNRYGVAEVQLGRGIAYTQEKKYDDALRMVEAGLTITHEMNARVLEIRCYNQLSVIWEEKGDYKRSLEYFRKYKTLEDALFSQEMQGKLLRDRIRFETANRDLKIAALSQMQAEQRNELKKQEFVRNILVVVMALSGIVLITVYRSGQRRRKINMLLLQHQEEMEKRSEELERLNQVKDKFFSIISHDLRSPINALSGMLDLLDKGAVTQEELPTHIRELRTRFNHTRTLLNNLLDWTLLQMDKLNLQAAKIDVFRLVEENIQLLEPIQTKDIHIINEIPNPAIGFADSNTINLVIRNLMTNALKFTKDGGKVVIRAEDKGLEWLISVRDNGVGIKPEVMKILFDKTAPYTTRGTANEKGTGLGLILCKEFVEKNGGKIWVESEEGHGSTFWFTLPKVS